MCNNQPKISAVFHLSGNTTNPDGIFQLKKNRKNMSVVLHSGMDVYYGTYRFTIGKVSSTDPFDKIHYDCHSDTFLTGDDIKKLKTLGVSDEFPEDQIDSLKFIGNLPPKIYTDMCNDKTRKEVICPKCGGSGIGKFNLESDDQGAQVNGIKNCRRCRGQGMIDVDDTKDPIMLIKCTYRDNIPCVDQTDDKIMACVECNNFKEFTSTLG